MMVINFIPCSSSLESTNRQGTSWAASSTSSRLESSGTSSPSYAIWTCKTHVPGNLRYISTFLLTMKNYTLLSRIIRLTIMWGMLFSAIGYAVLYLRNLMWYWKEVIKSGPFLSLLLPHAVFTSWESSCTIHHTQNYQTMDIIFWLLQYHNFKEHLFVLWNCNSYWLLYFFVQYTASYIAIIAQQSLT